MVVSPIIVTFRSPFDGAHLAGGWVHLNLAIYWKDRTISGFPVARGRVVARTKFECGDTEYKIEITLEDQFKEDPALTHPSYPVYFEPKDSDITGVSLFDGVVDSIITFAKN